MGEMMTAHLDYLRLKGRRPNSIIYRRRALERMAAALAPLPVQDAAEADLARWRASLAGLSDATVIAYVSNARGFYKWLQREGYRPDNPAQDLPVPPSPAYEPRPISEADLTDAVLAATGRVRIWLVLAAWCGLRACEIAQLRRACVRDTDPVPGIRISPDATKGGHRGRFVPLTGASWVLAQIEAAGLPSSGWCFPRLDGQPGHVTPHVVSHVCCTYLHDLGIPDTLHSLRHRFGTRLLAAAEGNIRVVQDTLGHGSLATTAVYTRIENAQAAAAVARIPAPRRLRTAS